MEILSCNTEKSNQDPLGVHRQNAGEQNAGQNCTGGQNASWFCGRVDKMPVLSIIFQKNNAE